MRPYNIDLFLMQNIHVFRLRWSAYKFLMPKTRHHAIRAEFDVFDSYRVQTGEMEPEADSDREEEPAHLLTAWLGELDTLKKVNN
jgi:hypothetical protein